MQHSTDTPDAPTDKAVEMVTIDDEDDSDIDSAVTVTSSVVPALSDHDLAIRLQAELDNETISTAQASEPTQSVAVDDSSGWNDDYDDDGDLQAKLTQSTALTDHELAVQLNSQFNADSEVSGGASQPVDRHMAADEAYAHALAAEDFDDQLSQASDSYSVGDKRKRESYSNNQHRSAADGDDVAFFLNHIHGLHPRYTLRLDDIVEHNSTHRVEHLVLINYMFQISYLDRHITNLRDIPRVTIIHGQTPNSPYTQEMRQYVRDYVPRGRKWSINAVKLPDSHGVMHSKIALVLYQHAVRVMICTANYLGGDWEHLQQAICVQDFPRSTTKSSDVPPVAATASATPKKASSKFQTASTYKPNQPSVAAPAPVPFVSTFEQDLCNYMQWYTKHMVDDTKIKPIVEQLHQYDFTYARVQLLPSVPGSHKVTWKKRQPSCQYGHMRLRQLLNENPLSPEFSNAPVIAQVSSLGALTEQYLVEEFVQSLYANRDNIWPMSSLDDRPSTLLSSHATATNNNHQLLRIIWPSVSDARIGAEGYDSDASQASVPQGNTNFLHKQLFHHWDCSMTGRLGHIPHIKTYTRPSADGSELAWLVMGSTNLSKAAWGQLSDKKGALRIMHYDLSVLWTPDHFRRLLLHALQSVANQNTKAADALQRSNVFYSATGSPRLQSVIDGLSVFGDLTCREVLQREINVQLVQPQPVDSLGMVQRSASTRSQRATASSNASQRDDIAAVVYRLVAPLPYNALSTRYEAAGELQLVLCNHA